MSDNSGFEQFVTAGGTLVYLASRQSAQFEIDRIAIVHRTGHVNIGETSIVIAVAAAHRQAALNGCSYAIERIKQILPVWKKEVWQDGAEWLQGV